MCNKKELNAALLTIYRLQSGLSRCGQTMTLSIANMTHNGMRMGEINMDGRCGDFHCRAKKNDKNFLVRLTNTIVPLIFMGLFFLLEGNGSDSSITSRDI